MPEQRRRLGMRQRQRLGMRTNLVNRGRPKLVNPQGVGEEMPEMQCRQDTRDRRHSVLL